MFWTDWVSSTSQKGKIEQAWMDGTNRKSLIESQLQWPNGLSIDYIEKKLYWCDAFLDKIERAGLDGSNREVCSIANCCFGLPVESSCVIFQVQENIVAHWFLAVSFTLTLLNPTQAPFLCVSACFVHQH
jgi:hypothetical protein